MLPTITDPITTTLAKVKDGDMGSREWFNQADHLTGCQILSTFRCVYDVLQTTILKGVDILLGDTFVQKKRMLRCSGTLVLVILDGNAEKLIG